MITKSELIEYLKHTPENTNYNILRSGLYNGSNKEVVDEFIEALSRGNLSLAALQPYLAKLYEDDKTISPEPLPPFSSGGTIPKPLTYDYMPEGYPKKSVQTTTLMEEQKLAFADMSGSGPYAASLTNAFEIVVGQTYTVNWDGTEYECVGATLDENMYALGNISIAGVDVDTGEPFLYIYDTDRPEAGGIFGTLDTSANHTISVKGIVETVTPMAEKFLPETLATKPDVEVAQTAANSAQTAANSAQAAANAAQTAADNAQSTADHKLDKDNPHGTGCFSLNTEGSTAVQNGSVAFGSTSRATGTFSFAHGGEISQLGGNEATGAYSHAEGRATRAIGVSAHAEGERTYAYGISSHAEGRGTIVHGNFCHVEGRFNKLDQSGQYAHVVGNGTENHLSNAYTLDWSGNAWFAGTVEGTALIIPSSTEGSTKKFKITVDDSGTLTAMEVTA